MYINILIIIFLLAYFDITFLLLDFLASYKVILAIF